MSCKSRDESRSAGWSWSGVREKYYYLAGGWRLVHQPNTVNSIASAVDHHGHDLTLVLNSEQPVALSIFLYVCEFCWIVNAAKF